MNTRQVSRLQLFTIVIVTAMMLVGCISLALIARYAPPMDPLSVVDAFHYAINSDDIDALLMLFADNAVVIDNGSMIEGTEEIRNWVLYSQRTAGLRLIMLNSEIDGETIIWLDTAHNRVEVEQFSYIMQWEATIHEGKIQSLVTMRRYRPDLK